MREGLKKTGDNPVAFGGFADVWEGTYGGKKVCVKALRIYNVAASTNTPNNAVSVCHFRHIVRLTITDVVVSLSTERQLFGSDLDTQIS